MMGPRQEAQPALFYEFSLEDHIPMDHLLRSINRFVDLGSICAHLADFYSHTGRPSVDPELLIRMLLVGYCFGIRSERRLCEEVHLNVTGVCAPRCSAYPVLRDLAHLMMGSAFCNVRCKFVSQIVGRGDLRAGSPAAAG